VNIGSPSPQGNGNTRSQRTHLIIPEEPRVKRGAIIFRKEACKALEDIATLERFERAQDDAEIAQPVTTNA
jgi:hypothetical protein